MHISDIEEDELIAARKRSIEIITQELQYPAQLDKVEQIWFTHYNKMSSLETQLKNIVNSQLKDAQEAIDILKTTSTNIGKIKGNDIRTQNLVAETSQFIPNYKSIHEVNTILTNLRCTNDSLRSFIEIPNLIEKVRKFMNQETNYMKAYMELCKLEHSRDELQKKVVSFPSLCRELSSTFKTVDQIRQEFDELIDGLLVNHFEIALTKPQVMIKVMQIVMYQDAKAKLGGDNVPQNGSKIHSTTPLIDHSAISSDGTLLKKDLTHIQLDLATESKDVRDLTFYTSLLVKSIRERFWTSFESCKVQVDELNQATPVQPDEYTSPSYSKTYTEPSEYYEHVKLDNSYDLQKCITTSKMIMMDLEKLVDNIYLVFPDEFDIRNTYLQTYHECFCELLQNISSISSKKINPMADTLLITKWIYKFYELQMVRLNGPSQRQPDMMSCIQDLIDQYREYVFHSADDLANRIIAMDRDTPPEILGDVLCTFAPITLFNIVEMHCDLAISSHSTQLILINFTEIKKVLLSYQQKFRNLLAKEEKEYDIPYFISQVNNNSKCHDYTMDLEAKAMKHLDTASFSMIILSEVMDGFQALVKYSRQLLLEHCFMVLEEDYKKIMTKAWYKEEVVETIIATLMDYFSNEIKGYLLDAYFRRLVTECLDKVVTIYIEQIFVISTQVVISEKTSLQLKSDASRLYSFFISWQVREKLVKARLQVLEDLADLMTMDLERIKFAMERALQHSQDLRWDLVNIILISRENINKKQLKSYMSLWDDIYDRVGPREAVQSGFFYSINTQSKTTNKVGLERSY